MVGTYDHSLNVYHHAFYRPDRTEHPCTYLESFPCSIQALPLSVGGADLDSMMAADEALIASIEPQHWYWIPKTVFVAVNCAGEEAGRYCFLPRAPSEDNAHATGTMSSVASEAPGASIAFASGGNYPGYFHDQGIEIDILSISNKAIAPLPMPETGIATGAWSAFVQVQGAGNTPEPTLPYGTSAAPEKILVGGAYEDGSEEAMASKIVDVASYYCRPVAHGWHATEYYEQCGTSYSAPTVAGSLAHVILTLRQESGYTGDLVDGWVDPILNITINDLRSAMNATATYDPEPRFGPPGSGAKPVPQTPTPWVQMGWGFYDARQVDATLAVLRGEAAPEKPDEAVTYMEAIHAFRKAYYGGP